VPVASRSEAVLTFKIDLAADAHALGAVAIATAISKPGVCEQRRQGKERACRQRPSQWAVSPKRRSKQRWLLHWAGVLKKIKQQWLLHWAGSPKGLLQHPKGLAGLGIPQASPWSLHEHSRNLQHSKPAAATRKRDSSGRGQAAHLQSRLGCHSRGCTRHSCHAHGPCSCTPGNSASHPEAPTHAAGPQCLCATCPLLCVTKEHHLPQ
jgi:hypothetical protein